MVEIWTEYNLELPHTRKYLRIECQEDIVPRYIAWAPSEDRGMISRSRTSLTRKLLFFRDSC